MKTKLLLLILLLPTLIFAQAENGFENQMGNAFSSSACFYVDTDNTTVHELQNYTNACGTVFVQEDNGVNTIGYRITLDPTTANGNVGFTDGDYFGVGTASAFTTELGASPPEGSQAFLLEDVDGTVTMRFNAVDLTSTTSPQFSMQYILESTGWEADDFVKITIEFTECGSPTVTLLDTTGQDIDDLGLENSSWSVLSANLSGAVGCNAHLVVEFSSNSASEELGIDAISFSEGKVLSTESFSISDAIALYPNPSNGVINIKNSGIALDKVVITDINGRTISSYDLQGSTVDKEIDLSSMVSSGMYFMSISSGERTTVKKFIVK